MDYYSCDMRQAQKWIDRKRVLVDGKTLESKNSFISGEIEVILFEPKASGLKPVFENDLFAVFDKPSGVLVHPNKLSDEYSLNDDIKALFGMDANVVHRIDKETSGLVLVSKEKIVETELKKLFESRAIKKEYLALVEGEISTSFTIDAKLKSNLPSSFIKIKSFVCDDGFYAQTVITPIKYYNSKDMTLLKASPLTGRTHQIRAHLFHVKHRIVGDPIYGLDELHVDKFLNKKMELQERCALSGADRLMLHANFLSFTFRGKEYNIKSNMCFKEKCDEFCS